MKPTAYTLILLFFFTPAFAQQPDTAIASVQYTFRHMSDTTMPTVFREENMILYVGNRMNIFLSLDKIKRDSAFMRARAAGDIKAADPKTSKPKPVITTQIISNKASRQLTIQDYLFRNYYYTVSYPGIQWLITKEKKQVAGYTCTKAEGYYKGRIYHAWFTTETKLEGAPWKLQGLPGLVLEAYDVRKQVFFELSNIETTVTRKFIILDPPVNAIATTKADYFRMREAARNDAVAFINSNSGETGMQINLSTTNGEANGIRMAKPANPLELVDD